MSATAFDSRKWKSQIIKRRLKINCCYRNHSFVKLIIGIENTNINAQNEERYTASHIAVKSMQEQCPQLIIN